jgi:O-antigen ligase
MPFGPFINRNHYAGWMIMMLSLTIGYSCAVLERARPANDDWRSWLAWLTSPEASRFGILAVAMLVMGVSIAMTRSRSGVLAFAVAILVLSRLIARHARSGTMRRVASAYVIVLLVGAVAWAGVEASMSRFSLAGGDMIEGRLPAWRDTLRIARDFPVVGTGMGTYAMAMLVYQSGDRHEMYEQAHNDYLQLVAEGGLIVLLPAVAVVVFGVRQIRHRFDVGEPDRATYWIRAGAVAGLVGIAAQSLVEFTLQMPGTRVLFVTLAAIALHRPATHIASRRRSIRHAHRV